jgi:DeoR/GlpR family transcriptional regulator of sugar metabolism
LEYIKDGDTVILDAGTTTLALAQLLKQQVRSAFIITCSVPVALELSSAGYDILTRFAHLRDVDLTITDSHLPKRKAKALEAAGATLRIVDIARMDFNRDGKGMAAVDGDQDSASPSRTLDLHRNRRR